MSKPQIARGIDVTYNVRPIFFDIAHELAYEGPCRFGQGDQLEPAFDHFINGEAYKGFLAGIEHNMPEGVKVLEPHRLQGHTDDWTISQVEMEKLCEGADETDFYFISTTGRTGEMIVEFAQMVKKPVAFVGNDLGLVINHSALKARGLECYPFLTWAEAAKQLRVLRARKILAQTRVMCVSRFNGNLSYHCASDSFIDLEKVTAKLGTKFRYVNLHEFIDQLQEIDPKTNYTTPGRNQENINAEDRAQIEAMTDELMAGAEECPMDREMVYRSVRVWWLVQKLMHKNECNAFTAVCPDACSTCRINKEKFTFCLTHSLNDEQGVPSACEYDVAAVESMAALEAIANKPAYMGNTAVLTRPDGSMLEDGYQMHQNRADIGDERWESMRGVPNLIMTGHSVGNRLMKGFDAPLDRYSVQPFAYSGFGATMRHDFNDDKGQVVTMCRFGINCDKLFVSRGTIWGGFGYELKNCTLGSIIQVEDTDRFFKGQIEAGNHVPFVFGDYLDELCALGESCGLEVVVG